MIASPLAWARAYIMALHKCHVRTYWKAMRYDRTKMLLETLDITAPIECAHHWVTDTPSGPMSIGNCKLCGELREFPNWVDNTPYWEEDVSVDQVSSGARFRSNVVVTDPSTTKDE